MEMLPLVNSGASYSGRERNCCFVNSGRGWFADISAPSGLDFPDDGRAIGLVDWNFDGRIDLWLCNRSGPMVRFMRNEVDNDNHFVALRLHGATCNRDAIGARVEVFLPQANTPLLRTLRAGEGFVSQGSKWVQLGLGPANSIDRVVIRWPDGAREEVTGVEVDQWFDVRQGEGSAVRWQPPEDLPNYAAAKFDGDVTKTPPRVLLARRSPLPELVALDGQGRREILSQTTKGRPMLAVLWASWCKPCAKELVTLQAKRAEFEAVGVDIVLLCVDGLSADGATQTAATELLERLKVSLVSTRATPELVNLLQIVHNETFSRHLPLGVPTSLLIDGNWQLAALYRGELDVDAVLADVARLPLEGDELLTAGLPYPGTWFKVSPFELGVAIARRLVNEGLEADAVRFVALHKLRMSKEPEYAGLMLQLGDLLWQRGQMAAAAARFKEAAEAAPEMTEAHYRLATAYEELGQEADAIAHYRRMAEVTFDPRNSVIARQSLAWILATCSDKSVSRPAEAVQLAEQLVAESEREDAALLNTLAVALASAGRFDEAVVEQSAAIERAKLLQDREMVERFESHKALFESRRALVE